MDVLSSMSTIAGYRPVLLAAADHGKFFPMLVTAAGTLAPAKVFIIGAGVAGLQAIATARRNGAVVEAFDVRPAVKEQVESLGAKFVELDLDTADSATSGGLTGRVQGVLDGLSHVKVDWPERDPPPFFNVNTPEDLHAACARLDEPTAGH